MAQRSFFLKQKKANVSINQLFYAIVFILVLALVLFLIFRINILSWIRTIPSYDFPEGEEIDYTLLSKDELILLGCTEKIAFIGDEPQGNFITQLIFGDARDLWIFSEGNWKNIKEAYVIANKDGTYSFAVSNSEFALMQNKLLKVNEGIIRNYDGYKFLKENSILKEDLILINGAHLIGARLFCKSEDELKVAEELIEKLHQQEAGFSGGGVNEGSGGGW